MLRRVTLILFVAVLSMSIAVPAFADQPDNVGGGLGNKAPNFSQSVYGDGVAWGTKGTTTLPAPNEKNVQSFDKLFVITNGAEGQLPVSEAAPGNPMYNGGRWFTWTATWANNVPHEIPVLTSYDGDGFNSIKFHEDMGHLTLKPGSPGGPGAPPNYFQCPLLPVK